MFLYKMLQSLLAAQIAGLLVVSAQDTDFNLTITFSTADSSSCLTASSPEGLTFTTISVPLYGECFNLDEVFGQNSTNGFRNQTPSTIVSQPLQGIFWTVSNTTQFDPSANYSQIWYKQLSVDDQPKIPHLASRSLTIYDGKDCQSTGYPIEPWFGWTCESQANGDCHTVPYNLQSFRIDLAETFNTGNSCWDFAYQGAAARISVWNSMAAILLVLLAISLN